jgi:hypothetical protein
LDKKAKPAAAATSRLRSVGYHKRNSANCGKPEALKEGSLFHLLDAIGRDKRQRLSQTTGVEEVACASKAMSLLEDMPY